MNSANSLNLSDINLLRDYEVYYNNKRIELNKFDLGLPYENLNTLDLRKRLCEIIEIRAEVGEQLAHAKAELQVAEKKLKDFETKSFVLAKLKLKKKLGLDKPPSDNLCKKFVSSRKRSMLLEEKIIQVQFVTNLLDTRYWSIGEAKRALELALDIRVNTYHDYGMIT